jgi:hypothetical protein
LQIRILILTAFLFASPVVADAPNNQPEAEWPKAFLEQGAKHARTAQLEKLQDAEFAKALAVATRNYYEALLGVGFSREEALSIVSHAGLTSGMFR